ncbi:MAG: THUMP domain-containing protein [Promethearchaeia archaeon]
MGKINMKKPQLLDLYNLILIRYSDEIWLKSMKVKMRMINQLMQNIKNQLEDAQIKYHKYQASKDNSRIFFFFKNQDIPEAVKVLNQVFGIYSFSPALRTSDKIKNIIERSLEVGEKILEKGDSFALKVKRSGVHDYTSQDVARIVGKKVLDNFPHLDLKVNLSEPDKIIYIEVRDDFSYVFTEIIESDWSGLPIMARKKMLVMDIGRINDLLAALLLAKRGGKLFFLHFSIHSDSTNRNVNLKNLKILREFFPFPELHIYRINLIEILQTTFEKIQYPKYTCALCRVIRFNLIEKFKRKMGREEVGNIRVIIDGLSLNNDTYCADFVDLQTLGLSSEFVDLPIFTPLIGLHKEDIGELLSKIPKKLKRFEYCQLKPKDQEFNTEEVQKLYNKLDLDKSLTNLLEDIEIIVL